MRLIPLALILAPFASGACSPAEEPASVPAEAVAEAPAAPTERTAPESDPALDAKIREIVGDAPGSRWLSVVDGEGDQRIALAYLLGMNWCGSGGCNLLILRPAAVGWEQVGNVSRVSAPVRVLNTSSHGLPDIGVTVSGGGGPPAYEAKLSFDGSSYPRFPSDEPLVDAFGRPVITEDAVRLLPSDPLT